MNRSFVVHAALLFSCVFANTYAMEKEVKEAITTAVKMREPKKLGKLLKAYLGKKCTLAELTDLAKTLQSAPGASSLATHFLHATQAADAFYKKKPGVKLSRGHFLETALFIEATLPKYISQHKYYVNKLQSGLPFSIDVDWRTKHRFIRLDSMRSAYIGRGAYKTVTKAIWYNRMGSTVVASAEQSSNMERELRIIKRLCDKPGILKTLGFGAHRKGKTIYHTIYTQLYKPGSLQSFIEKRGTLSLKEKINIAHDLIRGLFCMHKAGIVHRDLALKNFLVSIAHGKPGKRKIEAVITDFGWADIAKQVCFRQAQGTKSYISPEGLYYWKMKKTSYYASDVYALGCSLYWVFHGKKATWQNAWYAKNKTHSVNSRYHKLVEAINSQTQHRKSELSLQSGHYLSKRDRLELLILRMIEPNPQKRKTVSQLLIEIKKLM